MVALTKKKIIMLISGAILLGGLVFLAFSLFWPRPDYAGALKNTEEILSTEQIVLATLASPAVETPADINRQQLTEFYSATDKISAYYQSLSASTALKNEEIKQHYESLRLIAEKLSEITAVSKWLTDFIDKIEAEGYVSAISSVSAPPSNTFIQKFHQDIKDFTQKTGEFNAKYADAKSSNYSEMIEEHNALLVISKELEEIYSQLDLSAITGIATTDIESWFREVESLKNLLQDKAH